MLVTEMEKIPQYIFAHLSKIKSPSLLAFVFILTGSFSCEKEANISGKYSYSQTQCADKWAHGNSEKETIANMIAYLALKEIQVAGAVLTDPPEGSGYCLACTCATGRTFIIDVIIGSEEILEKEGFTRIN